MNKYFVHSIQKKRNKRKRKEETLQKAKLDIINQYYDIIDELHYKNPNISPWKQNKILLGIWNPLLGLIEFNDDLLVNLDQEIKILSNPVE